MATTKPVCLTQHLRHGDTRTRTKSLDLSLNDDERNYYICRRYDVTEIKEDYELLSERCQDFACLAVIHTQNGFACLEAIAEGVSLCGLGKRFDSQSAHNFPLKPTSSGQERTFMQLRPAETFYIQDLSLTLIPGEFNDAYVEATASAPPEAYYERYSQLVSQADTEYQPIIPSSPDQLRDLSAMPETPKSKLGLLPGPSPLINHMVSTALARHENSRDMPTAPEKREVLYDLRAVMTANNNEIEQQASRNSPTLPNQQSTDRHEVEISDPHEAHILDLQGEEVPDSDGIEQQTIESIPTDKAPLEAKMERANDKNKGEISSIGQLDGEIPEPPSKVQEPFKTLEPSASSQTTDEQTPYHSSPQKSCGEDDDQPPRKRPRLSPISKSVLHEESQDSLAGRHIEVTRPPPSSKSVPKEESQDSLAGKTVKVARPPPSKSIKSRASTLDHSRPGSSTPSDPATGPKNRTPSFDKSVGESTAPSVEPPSSTMSTRSGPLGNLRRSSIDHDGIRVLFASSASVGKTRAYKKFLSEQNVQIVKRFDQATCLCVGKGELKKTSKLISAVLIGIEIVTDEWIVESARLKTLQPIDSYVAKDPEREKEWGIDLAEAITRGRNGLKVFEDLHVIVTSAAKNELGKTNFDDLREIMVSSGAQSITHALPKKSLSDLELSSTLIIGVQADIKLPALKERRCFTKDIVGLSVLRGRLDVDSDEFLITKDTEPTPTPGKNKRKR